MIDHKYLIKRSREELAGRVMRQMTDLEKLAREIIDRDGTGCKCKACDLARKHVGGGQ